MSREPELRHALPEPLYLVVVARTRQGAGHGVHVVGARRGHPADASKYALSLGLATFSSRYGSHPGMLMAVTAVMTLPIIALFFIAQRTFIQGITLTGLKG